MYVYEIYFKQKNNLTVKLKADCIADHTKT